MFEGIDLSKLGNLDLGNIAKEFQSKANELKEESQNKTYTAKSGGGMIEATVNGNTELIDLNIDDSLLEDKDSMQILLISAINDAIKMSEDDKKNSAMQLLGGLNPFSGDKN